MKVIKKVSAISLILLFSLQPAFGMCFNFRLPSLGISNAANSLWQAAPSFSSLWSTAKDVGAKTIDTGKKHPRLAVGAAVATVAVAGGVWYWKHYTNNNAKQLTDIEKQASVNGVSTTHAAQSHVNQEEQESQEKQLSLTRSAVSDQQNLQALADCAVQAAVEGLVAAGQGQESLDKNVENNNRKFPEDMAQVLRTQQQPQSIRQPDWTDFIANMSSPSNEQDNSSNNADLDPFASFYTTPSDQAQPITGAAAAATTSQDSNATIMQHNFATNSAAAIAAAASGSSSGEEAQQQQAQPKKRNTNTSLKQIQAAAQKDIDQLNAFKKAFDNKEQNEQAYKELYTTIHRNVLTNVQKLHVAQARRAWQATFVQTYIKASAMIGRLNYDEKAFLAMVEQLEVPAK